MISCKDGVAVVMIRSFLPVGQGAFYLEQFKVVRERLNVIYDCGSLTDVELVQRQIRDNFERGETIQAVFISHLDDDHINGLPYLLKYCRVEKIFFPLIAEEQKVLMRLYYLCKNNANAENAFFHQFILDPELAIQELHLDNQPELYRIDEHHPEDREKRLGNEEILMPQSGENVVHRIFGKHNASEPILKQWEYIPFNFRQESRITELMEALHEEFEYEVKADDVQTLWTESASNKNKIKKAYRKVKGTFNTNSMTLFSGIQEGYIQQHLYMQTSKYFAYYYPPQFCDVRATVNGCLYIGDYDASGAQKWNQLQNAYRRHWGYIGCIQVPHHGSRHNYNHDLAAFDAIYIISAGYSNPFRHPHASVLKDLMFEGNYPFIVNEHTGSAVYLNIYF